MASPVPLTKLVARGKWGTIECVVRANGNCPVQDFLNHLRQVVVDSGPPIAMGIDKCLDVFDEVARTGELPSKHFGSEANGLQAFKFQVRNKQVRFPCFKDGKNKWILTFGFYKPGAQSGRGKWRKQDEDKAAELRGEYFTRKKKPAKPRKK